MGGLQDQTFQTGRDFNLSRPTSSFFKAQRWSRVTQQIMAESNVNSGLYSSPEPFASPPYYLFWPEGGTHESWERQHPQGC